MRLEDIGVIFAKQWIAGTQEEDAIKNALFANANRQKVALNYLGENFKDKARINNSLNIYFGLLSMMKSRKVQGSISIKPSQLGMLIGPHIFSEKYMRILEHAKRLGYNVWVDAEEYEYIDQTLQVVLKAMKKYKNTGLAIQARLKRSYGDAKRIAKAGGMVRLVKGAYSEPQGRAYVAPNEIRANFERIMKMLFRQRSRLMIATHDDYLIYKALWLQRKYKKKASFGLLKGIRPSLAAKLAGQGEDVSIYIPFGKEWLAYSFRRLKEEGHALLVLRSVFER